MGLIKLASQWLKDDRIYCLDKVWPETSTGQDPKLKTNQATLWTIQDTLEDACVNEPYQWAGDVF